MQSPEKQLLIGFNELKVTQLNLRLSGPINPDELHITLGFDPVFIEGNQKQKDFALKFNLRLNNNDMTFLLELEAFAYFRTNQPINDDFKTSDWVVINAPAIAFPFLRAYVSTVTLNSGIQPIILPSFNFSKKKSQANV